MLEYSFVIPVYNEIDNILPTINEINKFHNDKNKFEILFVDDDSPDGTSNEILKASHKFSNVRLIQHGKKEGIGAAIFYGCSFVKSDLIIFLDADLSQSPSYIIEMMNIINNGSDMVIGSRYIKGSKQINQSYFKKYGSYFFNRFTSLLLGIKLNDITHSFRIFKKSIYDQVKKSITQKGHPSFLIEFTLLAQKKKFTISEYPVTFIERDKSKGVSKLSISKELIQSLKFILKNFI